MITFASLEYESCCRVLELSRDSRTGGNTSSHVLIKVHGGCRQLDRKDTDFIGCADIASRKYAVLQVRNKRV